MAHDHQGNSGAPTPPTQQSTEQGPRRGTNASRHESMTSQPPSARHDPKPADRYAAESKKVESNGDSDEGCACDGKPGAGMSPSGSSATQGRDGDQGDGSNE